MIDITRGVWEAELYPGTIPPEHKQMKSIPEGALCTTSRIALSVHTGTHMDAPLHFFDGAADVTGIPLSAGCGDAQVVQAEPGFVTAKWLSQNVPAGTRRLLLRGNGQAYLTAEAAQWCVNSGVVLFGTDALTVSGFSDEAAAHRPLLAAGVCILETLDLSAAAPGAYTLLALPLKLTGVEGSPVRAILLEQTGILPESF